MSDVVMKVNSDGLELAAESFGNGPTIVAAHGLSGNRHITRRQFQPLADSHRIVIYDQRGHGDSSPVTNPSLYNPDRMAEDMRAVMDAYHLDKAIVQGESMGAATTLLFTLKYPQRVNALLLTGPAFSDVPNPDAASLHTMAQEIQRNGLKEYLKLSEQVMRETWNAPAEMIETIQFMQGSHNEGSLVTALDTVKDWIIFDDIAEVSQLTMPVCIIGWPNDPLHPIELAHRMHEQLRNSKLEIVPSVAHIFLNQGTMVGDIYRRFLEELPIS